MEKYGSGDGWLDWDKNQTKKHAKFTVFNNYNTPHWDKLISEGFCLGKCSRFQDDDSSLRFFIGNQATGGFGVTLTKATQVIYYSNSYDLEKRTQSEDRCHRIGQTKKVTYIDLIAEKTIDEKIVKALKNKIQIANEVMGEKAREWLI